jgi:NADH-quinone oxidoreductase subunit N
VQRLNEQLNGITESLGLIIPELIFFTGLLVIVTLGLFNNKRIYIPNVLTLLTATCSFAFIVATGAQGNVILFNGMLEREAFGEYLMLLVDVSIVITCLMSLRAQKKVSEYYALILSIGLGCHLLLMSTHLLMIFLALELISISSYVLAAYAFDKAGSEGSLKYFLFGSVASAIMLYGFTLLYGITGTLNFQSAGFFSGLTSHASPLLLVAGLMGLSGFLFKMAAVPMQPWAPDVYEAAPIPVIAYLSVAPKLAGVGILAKFILALHLFGQSSYDWQSIISGIAILTITAGNLSALWQKSAKRMMAYSSIAHSGFLLVGVAAFLPQGLHFMLFYASVYLLMNFAVFVYLRFFELQGLSSMHDFAGRGKSFIWPAIGITVGLVALTGLPPTAGFTGKLFIFSGLWEAYQESHKTLLIWLLIFGLLNTVISLFYYLRIPYFAFIKVGESLTEQKTGGFENLLGFILVVLIVVIFFIPGLLMGLINRINFVL